MSFDTVDELHSAEDQVHRQADAVRQVDDWLASASMLPMPQELREVVRAARLEGDTFCRCFCEANQCSCDDPDCDEHDDVSTCGCPCHHRPEPA